MPFSKPLPEWNALGTKPPQSKIDGGWNPDEKPPADWFNWIWNTTYQVVKEMQENSVHGEQVGNTIASLVGGKIPASQIDTQVLTSGTTAVKGIVQLSTATNSTSTTLAATPSAVKSAYDLANGKYTKPASGIPKTDLDTSVQTSLGKADTALQSVPDGTTGTKGIVQLSTATNSTSSTLAATASAVKSAYDLASGKESPAGAKLQIEQDSYKTAKSGKDANGIFTIVEHRRKSDNTLVRRSVLSGGTSPQYTTRTVTFYAANGTTVAKTDTFTLSYDADGDLISEV